MPDPLPITISNDTPHPNGNSAILSKSNANGHPNQATWTASDRQYNLSLPASVWSPPQGESLSFTLAHPPTSKIYTLNSNAPTGLQDYTIATSKGDPPPQVLIEP